jgi:hypothetical protein
MHYVGHCTISFQNARFLQHKILVSLFGALGLVDVDGSRSVPLLISVPVLHVAPSASETNDPHLQNLIPFRQRHYRYPAHHSARY